MKWPGHGQRFSTHLTILIQENEIIYGSNMTTTLGPVGSSLNFIFSGKCWLQLILSDCHCTIFSSWPSFLKGIKHLRRSKSDLSTGEIWFVSAHEIRFAANIPPPKMKYLWIRLQRRVTIWVLRWDALIIGDNHCLFVFPDDELAQFSSLHLPLLQVFIYQVSFPSLANIQLEIAQYLAVSRLL